MDATQLKRLARRIAPDLRTGPLYVVLGSELPSALRPHRDTFGHYAVNADAAYKIHLQSRGQWQGRGPAITINDREIRTYAREKWGPRATRGEVETEFLATFLHELAHVLQSPDWPTGEPSEGQAELSQASMMIAVSRPAVATALPEWHDHDGRFIRTLLHVLYRAEQAGRRVAARVACRTENYGLSSIWQYAAGLSDEPARLAGLPFSAIHKIDPPQPFAQLWREDVRFWLSGHKECEGAVFEAVVRAMRLFSPKEGSHDQR